MKNLFLLFAVAVVMGGCNASYDKTKSGVRYKIIKGKGGEKLKAGDIIKMNQVALIPERDTVLFSTYGKMPAYDQIDTSIRTRYSVMEVLPMMSVGDSAIIVLSVDTMVNRGMIPKGYDNVFRRGGQLTFRIRVIKKFANEEEFKAEAQKEYAAETERRKKEAAAALKAEKEALEQFISKNKPNAIRTPSGAFVEVQQKGTGPIGDTTMDAIVTYTGKLFKEGTTFDSNAGTGTGLRFSIGNNSLIKGFDEGMMFLGKGGKGKIYVPSELGYGANGSGDGRIPANATLVFEIEVIDIQKRTGGPMPYPAQVNLADGAGHSKDDGHGH